MKQTLGYDSEIFFLLHLREKKSAKNIANTRQQCYTLTEITNKS